MKKQYCFSQVVFHYFFYPMKFGRGRFLASSPNPNRPGDILSFGSHIDVIFDENLFLFLQLHLPSFICCVVF